MASLSPLGNQGRALHASLTLVLGRQVFSAAADGRSKTAEKNEQRITGGRSGALHMCIWLTEPFPSESLLEMFSILSHYQGASSKNRLQAFLFPSVLCQVHHSQCSHWKSDGSLEIRQITGNHNFTQRYLLFPCYPATKNVAQRRAGFCIVILQHAKL